MVWSPTFLSLIEVVVDCSNTSNPGQNTKGIPLLLTLQSNYLRTSSCTDGGLSNIVEQGPNKATLKDYVDHIEEGKLGCYWDPAGRWYRVHGDNKSFSGGKFYTETMKTSGASPTYRVRIMQGGSVALAAFDMPNVDQPSDDEVVAQLKIRV